MFFVLLSGCILAKKNMATEQNMQKKISLIRVEFQNLLEKTPIPSQMFSVWMAAHFCAISVGGKFYDMLRARPEVGAVWKRNSQR